MNGKVILLCLEGHASYAFISTLPVNHLIKIYTYLKLWVADPQLQMGENYSCLIEEQTS